MHDPSYTCFCMLKKLSYVRSNALHVFMLSTSTGVVHMNVSFRNARMHAAYYIDFNGFEHGDYVYLTNAYNYRTIGWISTHLTSIEFAHRPHSDRTATPSIAVIEKIPTAID